MRIGIIGSGMMGTALGALLQANGAQVLMLLEGRSEASRQRAQGAGLREARVEDVAAADFLLSVVPPDAAGPVVETALAHLGADTIFVECNALHPATARQLGARVEATGRRFVDAGIVGRAPSLDDGPGPTFYCAGEAAGACMVLRDFGLGIVALDAPVGAASALKMAIAGISKSMTGMMAQMLAYAAQEEVLDGVLEHLRHSHPALISWSARQFPLLDRKAGRWVQEMDILAGLTSSLPGGRAHFSGLSELYSAIAEDPGRLRLEELTRALAAGPAG